MEDDAFEGLQSLEYLDISDNKVLSLPAAALGRLPQLKRLKADYNRIGALSYEILQILKLTSQMNTLSREMLRLDTGSEGFC